LSGTYKGATQETTIVVIQLRPKNRRNKREGVKEGNLAQHETGNANEKPETRNAFEKPK
jgi:hypothetical protein